MALLSRNPSAITHCLPAKVHLLCMEREKEEPSASAFSREDQAIHTCLYLTDPP